MIRIGSEIIVPLADFGGAWPTVKQDLTIPNPAYTAAKDAGRWTGDLDEHICGYHVIRGEAHLPLGYWPRLYQLVRPTTPDLYGLSQGVALHLPDGYPSIEPHTYQREPMERLACSAHGIVVVPCGGGKTVIALLAAAWVRRSMLVIVHTRDLMSQWQDEIRSKLGIEPGQIGGGKRDIQPVTVATMQTLARWSDAERRQTLRRWGIVCVDECHHVPCESISRILSCCPASYRWGLTATPDRADGLMPVMLWTVGPVVAEVSGAQLAECGRRVDVEVRRVDTGWTYPEYESVAEDARRAPSEQERARYQRELGQQYRRMITAATLSGRRNHIITSIARERVRDGHTVLVLSGRVQHCERLAEDLRGAGVAAQAITSNVKGPKRRQLLSDLEAGKIQVLCATQLADEGLDIPSLDTVIQALPQRKAHTAMQRIGRLMRPAPGKRPVLYDLVDSVGVLQSQWRTRNHGYRQSMGEST